MIYFYLSLCVMAIIIFIIGIISGIINKLKLTIYSYVLLLIIWFAIIVMSDLI
jgi:hypothetical protein